MAKRFENDPRFITEIPKLQNEYPLKRKRETYKGKIDGADFEIKLDSKGNPIVYQNGKNTGGEYFLNLTETQKLFFKRVGLI